MTNPKLLAMILESREYANNPIVHAAIRMYRHQAMPSLETALWIAVESLVKQNDVLIEKISKLLLMSPPCLTCVERLMEGA